MSTENKNEALWECRKRNALGLPWTLTKYIMFSDRLVIRTGLFSITEKEVDLYKITDKQLVMPFLGRMLNYGTVICHAKTAFADVFEVRNIKNVRDFFNMFDKYVDTERDKYRVKGRDMIGGIHNCEDSEEELI